MINRFIFVFILILSNQLFAQHFGNKDFYLLDSVNVDELPKNELHFLDSTLNVFHTSTSDTVKAEVLLNIVKTIYSPYEYENYINLSYKFATEKLKSSSDSKEKLYFKKAIAFSLNELGYNSRTKGDVIKALEYYNQALTLAKEINYQETLSQIYNNLGALYYNRGDVKNALDYFDSCRTIQQKTDDKSGMAQSLMWMGFIYRGQSDYPAAQSYFEQSIALSESINDLHGLGYGYNNIGALMDDMGNTEKAKEYYTKGLTIRQKTGDQKGIGLSLNNIGKEFEKEYKIDSALYYYRKSLKIREHIDDKLGISFSLLNIGHVYFLINQYDSSYYFANEALKTSESLGFADLTSRSHLLLYKINKHNKNWSAALSNFETYISLNDSIKNEDNQKAVIRQQTKYEFEKEQLIKEQQEKEETRLKHQQLNRRNNLQYSIILVAILFVFGVILSLGKINVSPRFAEGLIFFAFLIFFEFCLVLIDPYIDQYSGGEPAYKLLFNALLAAGIFPAHAFFENFLKRRILSKK